MTRLAYWTGMRRWPSWTKTIAAITASARNGIITLKTWSGFVHHAWMPCGRFEAMEAKIISEIPLPMPRWVMSSPIHMSSTQPAVRQTTIRKTFGKLKFGISSAPAWLEKRLEQEHVADGLRAGEPTVR